MRIRKRKAALLLFIMMITAGLCGCTSKTKEPVVGEYYAVGEQDSTQTETETETEDAALYMVLGTDTTQGLMTFLNLDTGRNEQYTYTDGTYFRNKYGENTSVADFCPGKIVTVGIRTKSLTLDEVKISDRAWEYDDVVRFSVDEENRIFTIADTKYSYDADTVVFSNDVQTEMNTLTSNDVLRVQGIDRKILSVSVTTGHGVIRVANAKDLLGGWLSLNHKSYYEITDNMQLEVPEGEYELTVVGNGYGGSTNITVTRGEETTLDVDEIKGDGPKYCTLTFEIGVENATLLIDGKSVDYTKPMQVAYGIHSIQIEAEGYDTWAKRLFVNSSEATIEVAMTGKTEEETETSTEQSSETLTEKTEGTEQKTDNDTLKKLTEILDTLLDNKTSTTTSTGVTDAVINQMFQ